MLTAERVRELLEYLPDSGLLIWRVANSRRVRVGHIAGSLDNNGYIVVRIDRRIYKAARLAWLYMMGQWPKHTIDHKNGDPADNRWSNLREATYSQNNANRPTTAKSRFKGVVRSANGKRWIATVAMGNNTVRYLGTFDTAEEAHSAYVEAASKLFGEFVR